MYWPKFSYKKLAYLLNERETKSGASCSYLRWTKKVGLKMYCDEGERDQSFELQQMAEQVKLAPRTGEAFEFQTISVDECDAPYPMVRTVYCYWTEHVEQPDEWDLHDKGDKIDRLEERLAEVGIYHSDLWARNLGIKGRRLICIDFDPASCHAA